MRSLFTVLVATIIPFCALSAQNSGEHQDVFVPISKYIQNGDAEKLSAEGNGLQNMQQRAKDADFGFKITSCDLGTCIEVSIKI